jgi:hypothetical protein
MEYSPLPPMMPISACDKDPPGQLIPNQWNTDYTKNHARPLNSVRKV